MGAAAWWEQLQTNRRRQGKQPIQTWFRMRKLLTGCFLLLGYEQILYRQYQDCRQGLRAVGDYTEEFYQLNSRVTLQETDAQQVARYIGGLKLAFKIT